MRLSFVSVLSASCSLSSNFFSISWTYYMKSCKYLSMYFHICIMLAYIIIVYAISMHVKNENKLLTFFMLQIVRSSDLHLLPPFSWDFSKDVTRKNNNISQYPSLFSLTLSPQESSFTNLAISLHLFLLLSLLLLSPLPGLLDVLAQLHNRVLQGLHLEL